MLAWTRFSTGILWFRGRFLRKRIHGLRRSTFVLSPPPMLAGPQISAGTLWFRVELFRKGCECAFKSGHDPCGGTFTSELANGYQSKISCETIGRFRRNRRALPAKMGRSGAFSGKTMGFPGKKPGFRPKTMFPRAPGAHIRIVERAAAQSGPGSRPIGQARRAGSRRRKTANPAAL